MTHGGWRAVGEGRWLVGARGKPPEGRAVLIPQVFLGREAFP